MLAFDVARPKVVAMRSMVSPAAEKVGQLGQAGREGGILVIPWP
jgi:hypothetical protein